MPNMMEEKNVLRLRCCMLDLDGSMHDEEFKLINWDMPSAEEAINPRVLLSEELVRVFDDIKWPFKTSIRDKEGGLVPLNSGNLDWSDTHAIVRHLSNEQTASIFVQQLEIEIIADQLPQMNPTLLSPKILEDAEKKLEDKLASVRQMSFDSGIAGKLCW